jgi:hypothetical protein
MKSMALIPKEST